MKLIYRSCVRNVFPRQRNVGGFIARRMCKDDHCSATDGQDVGGSAAEAWASRQSSCKPQGHVGGTSAAHGAFRAPKQATAC